MLDCALGHLCRVFCNILDARLICLNLTNLTDNAPNLIVFIGEKECRQKFLD